MKKDYLELIMKLRESEPMNCEVRPITWEAADAIEELAAELHRSEVIIREQARSNRILRKIIQGEGDE